MSKILINFLRYDDRTFNGFLIQSTTKNNRRNGKKLKSNKITKKFSLDMFC